jgi:predicted DNA-binding transcriptional regulator AlpA
MAGSTISTLKKEQLIFLEAFEKNAALIQQTCKKVGIDRGTFYNWKKDNEEFAKKVEDIEEGLIDFAESKLYENIKAGESAAIFFFLKCKAKKRGYVERQEVEHSGTIDTVINFIPAK